MSDNMGRLLKIICMAYVVIFAIAAILLFGLQNYSDFCVIDVRQGVRCGSQLATMIVGAAYAMVYTVYMIGLMMFNTPDIVIQSFSDPARQPVIIAFIALSLPLLAGVVFWLKALFDKIRYLRG